MEFFCKLCDNFALNDPRIFFSDLRLKRHIKIFGEKNKQADTFRDFYQRSLAFKRLLRHGTMHMGLSPTIEMAADVQIALQTFESQRS